MRNDPIKVCMKCHENDQKDPSGRVVHKRRDGADPKLSKHGPIRDGNCAGCHNTHGSDISRLLKAPYPEAFYQPFSEDKYQLCFSCHDKQLVRDAQDREPDGVSQRRSQSALRARESRQGTQLPELPRDARQPQRAAHPRQRAVWEAGKCR
jgi:predicted CXXCH cytochrome family protein